MLMKHLYTIILSLLLFSTPAYALLDGDGYYRVQNYKSSRYVYVIDNTGSVNYTTTSADLGALALRKNFSTACCDPATVLYIKAVDSEYDIQAQGTGIYEIVSAYVKIRNYGYDDTYVAYATSSGITKYLGDGEQASSVEGICSTETSGEWRYWYILPIEADGDNYFGVDASEVEIDGTYYQSFYAEFPFTPTSDNVTVYYISTAANGYAVLKEITGVVPGETPVLIKSSSSSPSDNILDIGGTATTTISDNQLEGVYFYNTSKSHYNVTAYDSSTMRVLGTTSDGSLGFITSTDDYIPANTAYLSVAEGTAEELTIVTEDEYNELVKYIPASITISPEEVTLPIGESTTLTATILPTTATQTVTWSSSDESVATVTSGGVVTAVDAGTATITATTSNGLTATCTIYGSAGITSILMDADNNPVDVYNLSGVLLKSNADSEAILDLDPGVYIIGNQKVILK